MVAGPKVGDAVFRRNTPWIFDVSGPGGLTPVGEVILAAKAGGAQRNVILFGR